MNRQYAWTLDGETWTGGLQTWLSDRAEGHYSSVEVGRPAALAATPDGDVVAERDRVVVESEDLGNEWILWTATDLDTGEVATARIDGRA